MFITIVISCALGLLLGFYAPMIPYAYTKYTAIAIMAALDSIIGAINAALQKKYEPVCFCRGCWKMQDCLQQRQKQIQKNP